ncbi:hypothetical protein AX660_13530 [Paraglaciecola hydrolytica]|uniref:Uncharacterized protein n=1 Tax=Paraglaciecola hydrolytica TaxID=1799789 RepID=A0A136A1U3_9ALTE|nr:hypothetical protein AX660_13530 [Paraglaciecola hydrolytica]
MNSLRVFLSSLIFILSCYFLIDLLLYGFDWLLLLCSLVGFVCAHYLWPPKHDDETSWYDTVEVVIEFPFRAIALLLRGLAKIFKNADSGLDL